MTLSIREAGAADAMQIAALIELLGHRTTSDAVASRLQSLMSIDCPQLVAVEGERVVGLCGLHLMTAIHRDRPVGRITILVVAENVRSQGIGRMLVDAAEAHFRTAGCGMIELTSNDRLIDAHSFYESIGFQRTSKRFAKEL